MRPQEVQSLFADLDERLEYDKSHPGFLEWTKHGINDPDASADARAEWEAFEKWRDEDDKNRFFLNRRPKWSPYSRDPFLRLRIWKQNMADLDKYVNEINPDSKYLWRKGDPASFYDLGGKWYDQDGKSYDSMSSLMDSRKKPNLPWLNKTAAFRKTPGDRIAAAGVATAALGIPASMVVANIVSQIRHARAFRRYQEAYGHSQATKAKDLKIPEFAYNRLDKNMPSVFDDEEKALDALYPGWRNSGHIRKAILKNRIRRLIKYPQFVAENNSVFVPKDVDARVLAHELGHATDNSKEPLNKWERMAIHPNAIGSFIVDPENTPLMKQERTAWNNGGVPEADELRQAALDTYRESQESIRRPIRYGLGAAVLGALMMGTGLAVDTVGKKLSS